MMEKTTARCITSLFEACQHMKNSVSIDRHHKERIRWFRQVGNYLCYRFAPFACNSGYEHSRHNVMWSELPALHKIQVGTELAFHGRQALGSEVYLNPPVLSHITDRQYRISVRLDVPAHAVRPPAGRLDLESNDAGTGCARCFDQTDIMLTDREQVPYR